MDIKIIADQIKAINTRLKDLEYDWALFEAELTGEKIRCKLYHRGLAIDDARTEYWTFNFDGEYNLDEDLCGMFFGINEFISNMPRGDTLKQQLLVRKMEDAARIAEELNIDVDFVNPLVAIMEKLATNAITHRQ